MKKTLALFTAICMMTALLTACTGGAKSEAPAPESTAAAQSTAASTAEAKTDGEPLRVVLIGNQKFGDNGPMDDMAAGGEKAAQDFGIEFKKIESTPATFEDDIRAMSSEGYDMVITTFYYMSDATKTVAKEFPDTKYVAIFQSINTPEDSTPNLWDMEFRGQTTFYVDGYLAGLSTNSNKVGFIVGGEEPGPNAEANAFMRGVRDSNPDATVEFSYASYEDTALVKDVALAMIDKGCDIIQGDCGAADSGIVEASNEAGEVMVFSCICDFTDSCDYFGGSILMSYAQCVYDACDALQAGSFVGGETTYRDITNKGYYIDWSMNEAFAAKDTPFAAKNKAAIQTAKDIEKKIMNGELEIEFDGETPSWSRIAAE